MEVMADRELVLIEKMQNLGVIAEWGNIPPTSAGSAKPQNSPIRMVTVLPGDYFSSAHGSSSSFEQNGDAGRPARL
jgi:hypothetical protein